MSLLFILCWQWWCSDDIVDAADNSWTSDSWTDDSLSAVMLQAMLKTILKRTAALFTDTNTEMHWMHGIAMHQGKKFQAAAD